MTLRSPARGWLVLLAAVALLPAPAWAAPMADSSHETSLVVLSYVPFPSAPGTTRGVPAVSSGSVDRFQAEYGTNATPAAVLDGLEFLGPTLARSDEDRARHSLDASVARRLSHGSPLELMLEGSFQSGTAHVAATVHAEATPDMAGFEVWATLVEEDVVADCPEAAWAPRFWVRTPLRVTFAPLVEGAASASFSFSADPSCSESSIAVAVFVRGSDGDVVQSALWRARQGGPTDQARKAVLLELYVTQDCAPCDGALSAVDFVTARYGPRSESAPMMYLATDRPLPGALSLLGGIVIAGILEVWNRSLLRRQDGSHG